MNGQTVIAPSPTQVRERADLTSRDVRAITSRLTRPRDLLGEWKAEFDEWISACQEFRDFENEHLVAPETPAPLDLRQHRYLLFLLMARGERLALDLRELTGLSDEEVAKRTRHVDAFLDNLKLAWVTWHGEDNPAHRELLAPFLGSNGCATAPGILDGRTN